MGEFISFLEFLCFIAGASIMISFGADGVAKARRIDRRTAGIFAAVASGSVSGRQMTYFEAPYHDHPILIPMGIITMFLVACVCYLTFKADVFRHGDPS